MGRNDTPKKKKKIAIAPKSVDPLIKLTADINNVDYKVAKDIINFQFKYLKHWIYKPDVPQLYFQYLGKFTFSKRQVYAALTKFIGMLREDPDNEVALQLFRLFWELRLRTNAFHKYKMDGANRKIKYYPNEDEFKVKYPSTYKGQINLDRIIRA